MKILYYGAVGPQVQLLQLALQRSGYAPGRPDGSFGNATLRALRAFQEAMGLVPDGVAGRDTHAALRPWYTGYVTHTLRPGDTYYRLAQRYGTTVGAIAAANPGSDPLCLQPGRRLTVPLPFPVVPTDIDYCSALIAFCCEGLAARYPAITHSAVGSSVMGTPLHLLRLGTGQNRVLYNAAHHANEWITTPLLLRFTEALAHAAAFGQSIAGAEAGALLAQTRLAVLPAVDPDGIDLVTGDLTGGGYYTAARDIAAAWPEIPFPAGWKANIAGTDLNLQYPAGWEQAREIKFAQGYTTPAPRDYVGDAPLSAPEARAVHAFTREFDPALTLSYHTQGQVIYWRFLDYDVPGAADIARRFAAASGYAVETTPYASGFAGYKDWFIQSYRRPGYTIEAGLGENPLPITAFPGIYDRNLELLTLALTATA